MIPAAVLAAALAGMVLAAGPALAKPAGFRARTAGTPDRAQALRGPATAWPGSSTSRPWSVSRAHHVDSLVGVSCVRTGQCVAVGSYLNAAGRTAALAEFLDGRKWRLVLPPRLTGDLTGVSCVTASFCVAVGGTGPSGKTAVATSWNGVRWHLMTTPDPAHGPLFDVSCVRKNFCMATGGRLGAELWRGRKWRLTSVPLLVGSTSGLVTGLSCDHTWFCLAVGYVTMDPQAQMPRPLGETWGGFTWSAAGNAAFLRDSAFTMASCTPGAGCMAVGDLGGNLAARWHLGWQVFAPPGPAALVGISCVSAATNCMAVGSYRQHGVKFDLADVWNGKTWRMTRSLRPAAGLAAVSCPLAGRCVAVGRSANRATAEIWNGRTWRRMTPLSP